MTPSLYREQFLDRVWGPADLDAVAEFWLRLYESAAKPNSYSPMPRHHTEIRLRGFPRADADQLAAQFTTSAAASDFGTPTISHPDPDTLTLSTGSRDGRDAPPSGLGLPLLAAPEFDGLMAEIRFTARDSRGKSSSTLVLVGEPRAGSFVLKAVWRAGLWKWDDELAVFARWSRESAFLAAFDEFRSSGDVPPKLGKKLFPPRGGDRVGALVYSMIGVRLGQPRLWPLLVRALAFAVILAACGVLGYWAFERGEPLMLAAIGLFTLIVSILLWVFIKIERHFWFAGLAQFRALYTKLNDEGPKLAPPGSSANARFGNDPYVRKFTADLTAAGFTLFGDAQVVPTSVGEVLFRVFGVPDGTTYLAVVFQATNPLEPEKEFRFWPAGVSFVCHTFLTGGGYVASANGPRHGYRRKRTGPECLARVFPKELDPVEFVQLHAKAVARFVAETGYAPLRHVRFEEYLRLQNALTEEERRLHADNPYTWGDHLHWYLQIPRREYRA